MKTDQERKFHESMAFTLRRLRWENNVTHESTCTKLLELGLDMGSSPLVGWLNPKNGMSVTTLLRVAHVFGMQPTTLFNKIMEDYGS